METEDDDTIEYDIEVVTSSANTSLESNSINGNNHSNNAEPSTEPPQQPAEQQQQASGEPGSEPDGLDRIQADSNQPPASAAQLTEAISDEQRYAELIKDIGEFKLVAPLPSQEDAISPPEPPEPPRSELENGSSTEYNQATESEQQQVEPCSPGGNDRGSEETTELEVESVQVIELEPVVEVDAPVEEEEPEKSGDAPNEEAESAASLEQPSANEPEIPLIEPESSPQTEQGQPLQESSEPAYDSTAIPPAEPVATEEPGQIPQPGVDSHDELEGDHDLTVVEDEVEVVSDGANTCELATESDAPQAANEVELPGEVELLESSKPEPSELPTAALIPELEQPQELEQPPPSTEAKLDGDLAAAEQVTEQVTEVELVVEGESDGPDVVQPEPVEPSRVVVAETMEPNLELTEVEHDYTPSETAQPEIVIEVNEESPEAGQTEEAADAIDVVVTPTEKFENEQTEDKLDSAREFERRLSRDSGEDLEWEFDNEPVFERRNVQVKRNRDPRQDYELGDELGRGRFGTVFRCVEQSSGRKLAAKFVHMRRREDREDVEREVKIMSLLQHKRLLQLYDALDDGKTEMCLITELVEGGELFERIVNDDFELTEKKAAIFMRQICEGVDYMHSQRIVHLDMKPENILCVSKTGNRIKLIDFGLARQLSENEPLRVMFGTPDFAAPEVLAYDTVSLLTDMWSVGVICYVLLSGLSPFMGDNDMETMANVTRATFDFEDASFDPISDLAKDFISKLLVSEQFKRLKPSECLKHPWLRRGGAELEAAVRGRRESMHVAALQEILPEDQAALLALAATGTPPLQVSLDKRNLKKYVVRRKWHKTVHAIMALGRMGANLKSRLAG